MKKSARPFTLSALRLAVQDRIDALPRAAGQPLSAPSLQTLKTRSAAGKIPVGSLDQVAGLIFQEVKNAPGSFGRNTGKKKVVANAAPPGGEAANATLLAAVAQLDDVRRMVLTRLDAVVQDAKPQSAKGLAADAFLDSQRIIARLSGLDQRMIRIEENLQAMAESMEKLTQFMMKTVVK